MPAFLYFFALTGAALLVIFFLILIYSNIKAGAAPRSKREIVRYETFHQGTEKFYELVFSGTSILFFMASYYLIERFLQADVYRAFWDKYNDFLLLVMLILSCVLNSLLDRVFIRLKIITGRQRASIRLLGMLYMMLIFWYIKFIYENNNYDMFITYFLGLMVGRFVYFDASLKDFLISAGAALKNIFLMVMGLAYLSLLAFYGYRTGYLLKHNGVITNIFFAHLFMCAAIFILHHIHLADILVPAGSTKGADAIEKINEHEEYDDYEEYDNYEEYDDDEEYNA